MCTKSKKFSEAEILKIIDSDEEFDCTRKISLGSSKRRSNSCTKRSSESNDYQINNTTFNLLVSTPTSYTRRSKRLLLKYDESEVEDNSTYNVGQLSKGNTIRKTRQRLKTPKINDIEGSSPSQLISEKNKSIRSSILTPSQNKRIVSTGTPATPLQEAKLRLHVSAIPKSLPCREEEFNQIFTFLKGKLLDNNGGCIYISGVPGTGKTATVNEVIKCLNKLVTKGTLQQFKFIEINGMKLTEPRQAYVQIVKQLTGDICTWGQAYQILDKKFNKKSFNKQMILLLIDELDLLCNKRQDVVYNILDWPMKECAQLVVITIANTMDLPERVFKGKVTSRLGFTRLTFEPYNHKQLQEIVSARLKDIMAFKSEAIQLIARKVSAMSGDARRALDICRRAAEITEARNGEKVSIDDVNVALSEMIASTKVQFIKNCSEMEQNFLQSLCAEITRTGVEEVIFKNILRQLQSICSFKGIKMPTVTETLGLCMNLSASRILICEHSKADIYQKVLLNVSTDDVYYALQTDTKI
ncbi:origin recognition complex subunit 1 [Prorops nasuta]|uniref:origin recognition complex subunit 1 n=1 Tax=Prorops nasuta TaxID=863751 RepID=UPI0034CD9007